MDNSTRSDRGELWFSLGCIAVFLAGLALYLQSSKHPESPGGGWVVSPAFQAGKHVLYGNEGRFGMIRRNGPGDDLFRANRGGLYQLFFWGDEKELQGKYRLMATHKETGERRQLYEWPIQPGGSETGSTAQSGGKFGLNRPGLWALEVYVNDKLFDRIVVDVMP